jgi:hypothetical protein
MMSSSGTLASTAAVSLKLSQQSSSSTLADQTRTRSSNSSASGDPRSVHSARSRGSLVNLNIPSPGEATPSDVDLTATGAAPNYAGPSHLAAPIDRPAEPSGQPSDADLHGFADRFRSLVGQISREVDEGLDIVRRDSTSSGPHSPSSYTGPEAVQMLTAEEMDRLFRSHEIASQAQSDHVRVLGGYVRRMSTIESMGSREMGSASSIHRNETLVSSSHSHSGQTQHSPSTNANHEAPSRTSSLGVSSVATGGHGEGSFTFHGDPNGSKPLSENSDASIESPLEFTTSIHSQSST